MAKLPISKFLTKRLSEYDSTFELRAGTGFESLIFKPMQFILQPFRDEADSIQIAQSFRRILQTKDPDAFNEEAVDSLAANLFVDRITGDFSAGVARVYYSVAVDREWPAGGAIFTGSNSKTYSNPEPFAITVAEMGAQIENGLYYYDIPVVCTETGVNDLDPAGLISLASDTAVNSVTNKLKISGGVPRETNTDLIKRTKNSIAVRDLVTGKGANGTLFENFSTSLSELQPIGMGDPEMMRDILFNTHVGGKVDLFIKAPQIRTGTLDIVGLLLDTTRQSFTSTNVVLSGTTLTSLGNPTIDRSNNKPPIVQQVKVSIPASFSSSVDLTSPVDLSTHQYVRMGIDGTFKDIRIAGVTPANTTRNEIITLINMAFGANVIFPFGNSVRVVSPTRGLQSQVAVTDPTIGQSAALIVFGLTTGSSHVYQGDGPLTFVEGQDYLVVDATGQIQRVIGPSIISTQTTGVSTTSSALFTDSTIGVFTGVSINDILTIESGPDAGDYRVLNVIDLNSLILDAELTTTASGVNYHINRTGIKDGETVFIRYAFNPLSIDIGPLVKLDPLGKTRGVRPGRDAVTIKDMAFLRVVSLELIDPLTKEPLGVTLKGFGGYGVGGYGRGPFGIGSGKDYYLVVNSPTERFSAFEDSYIVISTAYQGFSLRVTYDYVPEVLTLHNFVRSDSERVLDGDFLARHLIPAYVSGEITYSVDSTDSSIPNNETLTSLVKKFIELRKAGTQLVFSEIVQFIIRLTDPYDRFGTKVNDFTLTARIHNTDGTTTVISGKDNLTIPTLNPFPVETPRPLSPRITHWLPDNIVLTRI